MLKWLGAVIGYALFRFPGALVGFLLGQLADDKTSPAKSAPGRGNSEGERVGVSDFELHLLSLCAIVIKADGKVNQSELDYVRAYFVRAYGKDKANAVFRTFNEVVKTREISAARITAFLNRHTRYEVRLQLLHFLMGLAQADGSISDSELLKLQEIARYLELSQNDFESIKAMFVRSDDQAYRILEISPNASNEEIKRAYRTMVKRYHPDKVNTEDEAIRKGAEEKFKEVQRAYEVLQQRHNM